MSLKPLQPGKQNSVIASDLLNRIPWVWHGFGTRLADGWPGEYTQLRQIHSDLVFVADDLAGCLGEGDALISSIPQKKIGIRTADCVPLLLADSERPVVAAVHAGWRGTVAEIAAKAVRRMHEDYGSDPDRLLAAIGPAIGECCFEVGSEVAEQFMPWIPGVENLTHVDLPAVNYRQLLAAGLRSEHVDILGLCTACDSERFHSFRRDREKSGRMVAAIAIV